MTSSFENIVLQWENMLKSGKIPCFEFELKDGEYLLVDLELRDVPNQANIRNVQKEICFSFDYMQLPTWFSGNVKQYHDCKFSLLIEDQDTNLDQVLELVYEEIVGGFIVPNDLLPSE